VTHDAASRLAFADEGESVDFGRSRRKEALFAKVSSDYSGLISRIALSYEADPGLRRDLVQDILLAVWLALDSFRGDSSLKTFIAAIAQKRSITHVTRRA
jgi:RNA polymerase sigma-70 factor (ECF subfamily)